MPNRLILCSLEELCVIFKESFPERKLGFSMFAILRPMLYIPVGPIGTHSVCVCTIHQNVKLMLDAANSGHHCHESNEMIVCDTKSRVCMAHRSTKCPGIARIQ